MDEDTDADVGNVTGLLNRLVTRDFDGTCAVVFLDKAFTSFKQILMFDARGIWTVGMA